VTLPASTSTSTRRCPSMWVNGSTDSRESSAAPRPGAVGDADGLCWPGVDLLHRV